MAVTKSERLTKAEINSLKNEAANLQRAIVEAALTESNIPTSPVINAFRTSHATQRDAAKATKQRADQLGQAIAELTPLENDLKQKQKSLTAAKSTLRNFYRPLGQAAFQGLLAGRVEGQATFEKRLALHQRIDELRKEQAGLAPPSDAGRLEKTKAKAKQLAVAGKIKIEETKAGKLETQIGQQLIDTNQEHSVECEDTRQLLHEVAKHREQIDQLNEATAKSHERVAAKIRDVANTLDIDSLDGSHRLKQELKTSQHTHPEAVKAQESLENAFPATLLEDSSISLDGELGTLLAQLRQCQQRLDEVPSSSLGFAGGKVLQLGRLVQSPWCIGVLVWLLAPLGLFFVWRHPVWSIKRKSIWTFVGVMWFAFLISMPILGRQEATEQLAEANSLWNSGNTSAAVGEYKQLLGNTYLDEAEIIAVLSRIVDYEAAEGNPEEAKRLLCESLDDGSTLTLTSQEAISLLHTVKREREEEQRRVAEAAKLKRIAEEKRRAAEVAESKRIAEEKRRAAEIAESERIAEEKRRAAEIAESERIAEDNRPVAKTSAPVAIRNILNGFPLSCLRATVVGTPQVVDEGTSSAKAKVKVKFYADHDTYDAFALRLQKELEKIATKNERFSISLRIDRGSAFTMKHSSSKLGFWERHIPDIWDVREAENKSTVVAVNLGRTESLDKIEWRYFVIENDVVRDVIASLAACIPTARLQFVGNNGEVIATHDVRAANIYKGNTWVAASVFAATDVEGAYHRDFLMSRKRGFIEDYFARLAAVDKDVRESLLVIAPFFYDTYNSFVKFAPYFEIERTVKLPAASAKGVSDVRCTLLLEGRTLEQLAVFAQKFRAKRQEQHLAALAAKTRKDAAKTRKDKERQAASAAAIQKWQRDNENTVNGLLKRIEELTGNGARPPQAANFSNVDYKKGPNGEVCGYRDVEDDDGHPYREWVTGDEKRHGICTGWYKRPSGDSPGQVKCKERYYNGEMHGLQERWYENGNPKEREVFFRGKRTGISQTWYENGRIEWLVCWLEDKKHGPYALIHPNGKLAGVGAFESGRPHGQSISWYKNGQVSKRGAFRNGKLAGDLSVWAEDGTVANLRSENDTGTSIRRDGDTVFFGEKGGPQVIFSPRLVSGQIATGPFYSKEELHEIADKFSKQGVRPGWPIERVVALLGKPTTYDKVPLTKGMSPEEKRRFFANPDIPERVKIHMKTVIEFCSWNFTDDPENKSIMIGFKNGRLEESKISLP